MENILSYFSARKWRILGITASIIVFMAALITLHHVLAEVHLREVIAKFSQTPDNSILLALGFTVASYVLLTIYDVLGLYTIGKPIPYPRVALASFTSYTFSHNIGLGLLTGGSIRYRIYSVAGLSTTEIANLTALCALTFGLGVSFLLSLALLMEPVAISVIDRVPEIVNRAFGAIILVILLAFIFWISRRPRVVTVSGWSLPLPGLSSTVGQFALGAADISLAGAALYFLLPPDLNIGFAAFVGIFVAAITIGVVSHSPGGLGVFEAVMLLALPGGDKEGILGALLVYRCIYYFLPFAIATLLLSAHELYDRREAFAPAGRAFRGIAHVATPVVLGTAVLACGAILLFSSATPSVDARIVALRHYMPLPLMEASHFLSSIFGLWLMILARGLYRRLDGAYFITISVLFSAIALSLIKGLDYEEALILAGITLMLVMSRRAFYRKASLFELNIPGAWLATICVVVAGAVGLGLFAFKHVEYSDALWWNFAYHGDASRFLRSSIVAIILSIALILYIVLRPARPINDRLSAGNLSLVREIISNSLRTDANLALLGDKRFCLSENKKAFLMYQVQGTSWVTMGAPIGPECEWEELLWDFRELSDSHGGRPVFYQIGVDALPYFVELGLPLVKIGEEARVNLGTFSLEGGTMKGLRYIDRRARKEGAEFSVVPAIEIPGILHELKNVSDTWLKNKSTHEKGFSVGTFAEDYISNFDCAVVRRNGEIMAFANIWQSPHGGEISVDLMRYRDDAPYGMMDFLFINTMLWGKNREYRWFNLGMAPLSGLETHSLAPTWAKAGAFIFRHGEHFYNFEGLRAYKEKYEPDWAPKYIASPGGMALPRTLIDVATLISGGTKEVLFK